ncbi:BamA/TamA family outer membrane protein [Pedobacter sp. MW01-1-1]|uniref:BamA/TamA family outer membrane protein n=1 Tax=Pedobacter sp. MW01-1-1 TaxID=3383027 RepID=UPI003FEEA667
MSDYLIDAHGFILVPTIISEPALGGFGGALIPVFLNKRPPIIDTLNGKVRISRVNPDITGALGMYTANNTWATGVFRMGTFAKPRITYKAAILYGDVNMNFYHTLPVLGEQEFNFNLKTVPLMLEALKQFNNVKWSAGLHYKFSSTRISTVNPLPSWVPQDNVKVISSQVGGVLRFDGRDNIFTPDKGIRFQSDFYWGGKAIGSDFENWRVNYSGIGYTPLSSKFVGGVRIEGQQAFGSVPFYQLPFINMRGIPTNRFQGRGTLLTEGELRWDFYKRWSIVGFTGVGAAFDSWSTMFDRSLAYNYGTGFRYLIARKFKLRMGMDFAGGPGSFGYYIVFGSSWFR